MGIFRGRRGPGAKADLFWRIPPFPSRDPYVLHAHGITCVTRSDGPGMMSTGWAIWDVAGIHMHQARDFLVDGYNAWRDAGTSDEQSRVLFLEDMFHRLGDIRPAIPPSADLATLAPGVVAPASVAFTARCWAASELLECLERASESSHSTIEEGEIYQALSLTHPGFMPARTASQFRHLSRKRGLA